MRKALVLAALALCCLSVTLAAQGTIYNPSNTPNTGGANSWPFRGISTTQGTRWRFQFIINASVLPNAPIKITDIAFAPTVTKVWSATQFQVRMGHTTYNSFVKAAVQPACFDNMLGPCPTICYNGPIKWACKANAWSPIRLRCPFGYDGRRNICVEIRYNGGPGSNGVTTRTASSINRAYMHNISAFGGVADPWNHPCWIDPIPGQAMGPKHCLSYARTCVLLASDTVKVGQTAGISIIQGPSGGFYQIAASLGQGPGFSVGNCHICLSVDPTFWASIFVGPPVFNNYAGTLTASGSGGGKFAVPNIPFLAGLCVYHAAILFGKGGICCTNTDGTKIVP